MRVNFLFMSSKLTVQRLEKVLRDHGVAKNAFLGAFSISKQRYQNWKNRGIPANELPAIARYIQIPIDTLISHGTVATQYRADRQKYHQRIDSMDDAQIKAFDALLAIVEDTKEIKGLQARSSKASYPEHKSKKST